MHFLSKVTFTIPKGLGGISARTWGRFQSYRDAFKKIIRGTGRENREDQSEGTLLKKTN